MALSNFTELKASIASWLFDRTDLTATIPDFITLAEADMNSKLRHWRMEESTTLSVSSQFTALPSDFIGFHSATLEDTTPRRMELVSRADMQEIRERADDVGGKPIYYCLTDEQFEVYPSPSDTYSVTLIYYRRPTALSDSNADNWVLTYHPGVYLYGSLLQAAPFLIDDERIPVWSTLYQNALQAANDESTNAQAGADGLRMKIRGMS